MKIKKFNEMFEDKYDYKSILNYLTNKGWGIGILSYLDDFESNSDYFESPQHERDYAEQFHVYLVDLFDNRLRGKFNNTQSLRLGKWKTGVQVNKPVSIYNKLY